MESDSDNDVQKEITFNEEDEILSQDRETIKQEISNMSFEDLQKLKEKIGAKIYNETVFGVDRRQPKTTNFKRANKNRPREMSSKKRINFKKEVAKMKKPTVRDPRFDPLCGTYDEGAFRSNYKFLHDMRKKELTQLEKELEKTEDPHEKKKIKYVHQRMGNQIREYERREAQNTKLQTEKQEIRHKLKKGEKPLFKKKSEKRLESLIEKYEELKQSNKLQKHIEKRSRKLAIRDKIKIENNTY